MNKKLYEQAENLVKKEIEKEEKEALREEREELKERIKEKYNELKYESEHLKADKTTMKKIKQLYAQSKPMHPQSWIESMSGRIYRIKSELKECCRTGIYHPKRLKEIEKDIKARAESSPKPSADIEKFI